MSRGRSIDIRVIIPVLFSKELVDKAREEYEAAARPDVRLSFAWLSNGTNTIESEFDVALAQPDTIRLIQDAEREGINACIIACFSDPGGGAAKQAVQIPVVGEGEAALHFANLLGYRYSILTPRRESLARIRNVAARAGLGERLLSVRAIGAGVMDLSLSLVPRVVEESVKAVRDDGADVIVMGCTGTGAGMAALVESELQKQIGAYIPVIDPVLAAIKLAEALVDTKMSHSKIAYPTPPSARAEYQLSTTPVP